MKEHHNEIKEMVKQKYDQIALQGLPAQPASCCGSNGEETKVYNIMSEEYTSLKGYHPEADLKLGCGLPTEFARIKKGDTVIDLGSGAGNDCFVARHETGEAGKVIGIDFSEEMIRKARINAYKLRFNNVEFRTGDIEDIPVADQIADVVVSNCVMNLVPDKAKAFSEVHRILREGGHFSISDIVITGDLPAKIKSAAEMYAGCVASAIYKKDYLEIIEKSGFDNLIIQKKKPIVVPEEILKNYLSEEEITAYNQQDHRIFSITVYAEKPRATCCG